jgi:hypothetical protein
VDGQVMGMLLAGAAVIFIIGLALVIMMRGGGE